MVTLSKTEQTYNTSGKILTYTYSVWDNLKNQWVDNHKNEYTYDSDGNNTSYIQYIYDRITGQLRGNYQTEITFIGKNAIQRVEYLMDTLTKQYVFHSKYEYGYSVAGNLILSIEYTWDKNTSQWVGNLKRDIQETLVAEGTNTITTDSRWNIDLKRWDYTFKSDATFDNNHIYENSSYFWDTVTGGWFLTGRSENRVSGSKIVMSWSEWKMSTHNMSYGWKTTTYQSEHPILNELPENTINVYPNPSSDKIILFVKDIKETARIKLFDSKGKIVMDQKFPVTGQITVNQLASGLYLYQIHNDTHIYKGKFVVVK
jgi:hypothetical protein